MLVKKMKKKMLCSFCQIWEQSFSGDERTERCVTACWNYTLFFPLSSSYISEDPGRKGENLLLLCKELNKDNTSFFHDNPPLP